MASDTSVHRFDTNTLSEVPDDLPALPVSRLNRSAFARVAESSLFQNLTMLAIMLNAAWICVDVQWNHASLEMDGRLPLEPGSIAIENLFCVYFCLELLIRFLAFRKGCGFLKDTWFVFDGLLLVFMVLEVWLVPAFSAMRTKGGTGNLASLRLLRLLRLSRLAGLMRFFPELITLARGMVKAMESVLFVLLFLLILTYGTSILFTAVLGKPLEERSCDELDQAAMDMFGDIGSSMMSLITHGVLGDNLMEALRALQEKSLALMWVFIIFLAVSGITLLNMLIGVLCKVIEETASSEEGQRKAHELQRIFVRAFHAVDLSNDGFIQEQEWSGISQNPEVRDALFRLGVEEYEMDLRLEQVRAKVFAPRPPRKTLGPASMASSETLRSASRHDSINTAASMPTKPSRRTLRQQGRGLDLNEFVEQVSDLAMDKKASTLDVETFKGKFQREAADTKKKLETLERRVRELLTQPGICSASAASTAALAGNLLRAPAPVPPTVGPRAVRGVPLPEAPPPGSFLGEVGRSPPSPPGSFLWEAGRPPPSPAGSFLWDAGRTPPSPPGSFLWDAGRSSPPPPSSFLREAAGARTRTRDQPVVSAMPPVMREQLQLVPTPVLLETMRLRLRGDERFGNLAP